MDKARDIAFFNTTFLGLFCPIGHQRHIESRASAAARRLFLRFFDDPLHSIKRVVAGVLFLGKNSDRTTGHPEFDPITAAKTRLPPDRVGNDDGTLVEREYHSACSTGSPISLSV